MTTLAAGGSDLTVPSEDFFAITPSDDAEDNFANPIRSLYVGTGGDVAFVKLYSDEPVVVPDIPSGYIFPGWARRIHATGTTASGLIGLL